MAGLEHFTVDRPRNSWGVRILLQAADNNSSTAELTLRPERADNVVPLRDTITTVRVTVVRTMSHPTEPVYLCTTAEGDTLTVTVYKGEEREAQPARATLVRGPYSPAP